MDRQIDEVTEKELAVWERLASEATPGPWGRSFAREIDGGVVLLHKSVEAPSRRICEVAGNSPEGTERGRWECADAAFIAAARSAVPRLVAEVRRLRSDTRG